MRRILPRRETGSEKFPRVPVPGAWEREKGRSVSSGSNAQQGKHYKVGHKKFQQILKWMYLLYELIN